MLHLHYPSFATINQSASYRTCIYFTFTTSQPSVKSQEHVLFAMFE